MRTRIGFGSPHKQDSFNAGEIEVVHASSTGSIIGNRLLVVGVSLLVGGLKNGVQQYDIALDGQSNWVEGLRLTSVYIILGLAFSFLT